jgi:putative SOS response-associated peptidase YedK
MCFSVNVNLVREELENRYGATFLDPEKYNPSYYYHAFGLPELPVICSGRPSEIQLLKWGLIPTWIRSIEDAEEIRLKTFNARAESVDTKPSFSQSFVSKRCIIPVKGFFEWQHRGSKKIPWYIYAQNDEIISFAGLWNDWVETKTGELYSTFTIITTDANELMSEIHNTKKRMPVILDRQNEQKWINQGSGRKELLELLKPYPSELLNAYTVSDMIGRKSANRNTAEVIKPFSWESGGTLF